LDDCYWYWDDVQRLQECIPPTYTLLERLCQQPFKKNIRIGDIIFRFISRSKGSLQNRFLTAPDASFIHLEKSLRSKNSSELVVDGLWAITRNMIEFTIESFVTNPKRLLETAKLLGSLRKQVHSPLLTKFKEKCIDTESSNDRKLDMLKDLIKAELIGNLQVEID